MFRSFTEEQTSPRGTPETSAIPLISSLKGYGSVSTIKGYKTKENTVIFIDLVLLYIYLCYIYIFNYLPAPHPLNQQAFLGKNP